MNPTPLEPPTTETSSTLQEVNGLSVQSQGKDLEAILRSPWKRLFFMGLAILFMASVSTTQFAEGPQERFFTRFFLHQVLGWTFWGLLAFPIVRGARWLWSIFASWVLSTLLQILVALIVAFGSCGFLAVVLWALPPTALERREAELANAGRPEFPPRRNVGTRRDGPFAPRPPSNRFERPRHPNRQPLNGVTHERPARTIGTIFNQNLRRHMDREILIYWMVVGVGLALQASLGARAQERQISAARLKAARMRTEVEQSRMAALRNQVQPHFLFNSLHTIGGQIRQGQQQSALKTLSSLGKLLRRTLDYGEADESTFAEEVEVAQAYLEIEEFRYGDRLKVEWRLDPSVSAVQVPTLFLLPLVENAIKYAIAPRKETGHLHIWARVEARYLIVEILDDGPGFENEVLAELREILPDGRRPIGLRNTQMRLRMLYGDSHHFEWTNRMEGGACVRVRIPVRTELQEASSQETEPGEPNT